MLYNYLPILIFTIFAVLFGVIACSLGALLSVSRPSEAKNSQYECGFEVFGDTRSKFNVKFYLVAILFIIFDLEVAFLFPWALVFNDLGWAATIAMGIFLGLLLVGFIYEWKKGALEWE